MNLLYASRHYHHCSNGVKRNRRRASSREFNQDSGRAKKAARDGPVFITDRGKPAHVLLSIEEYQRLTRAHRNIADALALPGAEDADFDPPRVRIDYRPADFD